VSGSENNRVGM